MTASVMNWEPGALSLGRCVVAIGVFDGVHLGHQDIVRHAVERAAGGHAACVALTFDRDPDQVVTPDSATPQLLTLEDKTALLGVLGPDAVMVVPFDVALAQMPPERFVADVVLDALEPISIVVGADFRFGRNAAGDVHTLERLGDRHGFEVVAYDLIRAAGAPVTSTRIRAAVAAGDVVTAASLLGRPHRVAGGVRQGRGVGAMIGVPTANIHPHVHAALPADGVYAGRCLTPQGDFPAAISVGTPPSFPEARDVLEAHLIGFEGDLYGAEVALEFIERLRDQRVFATAEELASAIRDDITAARAVTRAW